MKKLLRNWIPLFVFGIFVSGCQIVEKDLSMPALQASGEIVVGEMGTQGPLLTISQEEASYYLSVASGTQSGTFTNTSIVSGDDGNLYLQGKVWDDHNPEPNSITTAIALTQSGETIYLRLNWKKCKGNDCTGCDFNETKTGCICSDNGKCDYSEGSISSWSNY